MKKKKSSKRSQPPKPRKGATAARSTSVSASKDAATSEQLSAMFDALLMAREAEEEAVADQARIMAGIADVTAVRTFTRAGVTYQIARAHGSYHLRVRNGATV